jgi:hypothetical protein
MDEKTQKDIFNLLRAHNRYDLIAVLLTLFEEIDSDYEPFSEDEPDEEFSELGAIPEDPSYCISDEGFHYLS